MPSELSPIDKAKFVAAKKATEYVKTGKQHHSEELKYI